MGESGRKRRVRSPDRSDMAAKRWWHPFLIKQPLYVASAGVCAAEQRVLFGGSQLVDGAVLSECGVSDDSQLYVSLRLLGGAKKRKKKTYTKPKKQKHKHAKVKLRVLKYYKVSDAGKVERLRKVCPNCGPGVFMATHMNRVYCGKCHLTYVYHKDGQTA